MRRKIELADEKRKMIFNRCAQLSDGHSDVASVRDSLHNFIKRDLKGINEEVYNVYIRNEPKLITIRRVLALSKPYYVSYGNNRSLETLIDCYLGIYESNKFPQAVVKDLALYSACRCASPRCKNPTCGPSNVPDKLILIGEACFINSPHPNSIRHDTSVDKQLLTDVSNGIWLCPQHAKMINADDGNGYTAEDLKKMKRAHEDAMRRILFPQRPSAFSFISGSDHREICTEIFAFLEDKDILYSELMHGVSEEDFVAIKEIIKILLKFKRDLIRSSTLFVFVGTIIRSCRYFLNKSREYEDPEMVSYCLFAVRKIIGASLLELSDEFNIALSGNIRTITPN